MKYVLLLIALLIFSFPAKAGETAIADMDTATISCDDELILQEDGETTWSKSTACDIVRFASTGSLSDVNLTGVATDDLLYRSSDGNWYVKNLFELAESNGTDRVFLSDTANPSNTSDSVIIAPNATITGSALRATIIGADINTGGLWNGDNVLIGYNASAGSAGKHVIVGNTATVSGTNTESVCVGYSADCNGWAVAVGGSAQATIHRTTAIGPLGVAATANRAVAVGSSAAASGVSSIALGADTVADQDGCVAIGQNAAQTLSANCDAADEIELGTADHTVDIPGNLVVDGDVTFNSAGLNLDIFPTVDLTDVSTNDLFSYSGGVWYASAVHEVIGNTNGTGNLIIGSGASADSGADNVIGLGNNVNISSNDDEAVAIGYGAKTGGANDIAIGPNAGDNGVSGFKLSIGHDASASAGWAVALGDTAAASASSGVAIGKDATADQASCVALGQGSNCDADNTVTINGTTSNLDVSGDLNAGGSVTFASAAVSNQFTVGSIMFTSADGTNGQVLTTDGSGNVTFQDASGGGISGTVFSWSGHIVAPEDKTYYLAVNVPFAGTVNSITADVDTGTCDMTGKINGTALGAGTAVSVTSTENEDTYSTNNTFSAGDDLTFEISSNSACDDLRFTVKYTR